MNLDFVFVFMPVVSSSQLSAIGFRDFRADNRDPGRGRDPRVSVPFSHPLSLFLASTMAL